MRNIELKNTRTVRHIRCGICGRLLRIEMDTEDVQYEKDIAKENGWSFDRGLQVYLCWDCT